MSSQDPAKTDEERLRAHFSRGLAGDEAAYAAFLKALSGHLRAYLRRRLSAAPDEVEDLVQEALLAIHNQRHTYDVDLPLTAWVHAIAKYKLVDHLRRRAGREQLTEPLDDWIKLSFPVSLGVAALVAAWRLGLPGTLLGHVRLAIATPVVAMWLLALVALVEAPAAERASLVLGQTWDVCPYYITLLSAPAFVASMWAMRGLAPTRPAAAGAISGLLAGALGAAVYALHCPEMAPPFLGTWYLAGMLIPAAAGALVGARLFRW